MTQTDRLDVGDEKDELAHGYTIGQSTYAGKQRFDSPTSKVAYIESGRATKSFETFRIKVTPWTDHLLVKMFDAQAARGQKLRVYIDGTDAGEWIFPDQANSRYGEAAFAIPAERIGDKSEISLRLQYAGGRPDTNSFLYWAFSKQTAGIAQPLKADLHDLALIDYLDVGDPKSEADHKYAIKDSNYFNAHDFPWPAAKTSYRETLRATKSFETFRLKVTPGKDNVLVKALDTFSKDQKVRVSVNNKVVAKEWALPNGPTRYDDATLTIKAQDIGQQEEITVKIEFISASMDTNSLAYWTYSKAQPIAQGR